VSPTAERPLEGKVALITGSSRGIGLGIAQRFAAAGASVMLSSRRAEALEVARAQVEGDAGWCVANAGEPADAALAVATTIERFGSLDVLVNNAATNPYLGPAIEIDLDRYDKTWKVNLRGPFVWIQEAWAQHMAAHGGSVVNIASIGGLAVEESIGIYNVTKAALIHLTKTLAVELAPRVRVNAIAPGLVRTDMARALWKADEPAMSRQMPLGRLGEPSDIAEAALYFATDSSSWVTGHTMVVDGGALVHPPVTLDATVPNARR
jgi:NAD(P)-dependent dehydrogenase (short-subunit alcohol dehydrogenase family)